MFCVTSVSHAQMVVKPQRCTYLCYIIWVLEKRSYTIISRKGFDFILSIKL